MSPSISVVCSCKITASTRLLPANCTSSFALGCRLMPVFCPHVSSHLPRRMRPWWDPCSSLKTWCRTAEGTKATKKPQRAPCQCVYMVGAWVQYVWLLVLFPSHPAVAPTQRRRHNTSGALSANLRTDAADVDSLSSAPAHLPFLPGDETAWKLSVS